MSNCPPKKISDFFKITIKNNWKTWKITNINASTTEITQITSGTTALADVIAGLDLKSLHADAAIAIMEAYNVGIDAILAAGIELPQDFLEKTFAATNLSEKIAWDEYAADRGEWVGISDRNIEFWTDNPIIFERDPNNLGTNAWLVRQQDENGDWVGMGFTDEETALAYARAFGIELLDNRTRITVAASNLNSDTIAETLAGLGIVVPIASTSSAGERQAKAAYDTTPPDTTPPVEWMSKAEKEKWKKATKRIYMNGKDRITEYDSTLSPGAAKRKIEHQDGSYEYEYDSEKNPEHMQKRKVENNGQYENTYDSEKRADGKESETGNPREGKREMKYNSDKEGTTESNRGRQTRIQNEDGEAKETFDPEKSHNGKKHYERNTDGSSSVDYDPNLSDDGRTHQDKKADGSYSIDFDPEKSVNGRTHYEGNTDGSYSSDFDPEKHSDGKIHQDTKADGSWSADYDPNLSDDGRTHQDIKADGSYSIDFDPEKSFNGITHYEGNTDGTWSEDFDPEKGYGRTHSEGNADGSYSIDFDPNLSDDGLKRRIYNIDRSSVLYYNDNTWKKYDPDGNQIDSGTWQSK